MTSIKKKTLPMFRGITSVEDYDSTSTSQIVSRKKSFQNSSLLTEESFQKTDVEMSMKRFEDFSSVWKDDKPANSFHFNNNDAVNCLYVNGKESNKADKNKSSQKNSKSKDDLKRKSALEAKWNLIKEQKSLVKKALKNINITSKDEVKVNLESEKVKTIQKDNGKITLFDDDSSEENTIEPNFEVKSYLQGEEGLKRLNLKARLANDNRFQVDERFFDDRETHSKNTGSSNKNITMPKLVVRYDPSKPVLKKSSQIDTTQPGKKKKKVKNKLIKDQHTENEPAATAKPGVSKEKHYLVSDSLKNAFKKEEEKTSFSLSDMFDTYLKEDQRKNNEDENVTTIPKKRMKCLDNLLDEVYPSEEEDAAEEEESSLDILSTAVAPEKVLGKCGVWGETFFFKIDDSRLKEGLSFLQNSEVSENKDFDKRRKQLRSIVKKKIQNTRRDKKLFKQKLGGRINKSKFKMRLKKVDL